MTMNTKNENLSSFPKNIFAANSASAIPRILHIVKYIGSSRGTDVVVVITLTLLFLVSVVGCAAFGSDMELLHVLLANLLIQLLAAVVCALALRRVAGMHAPMMMSSSEDRPRDLHSIDERIDDRIKDKLRASDAETELRQTKYAIELEQRMREIFVSKEDYTPVRMLVWGMVGLILTTVLASLLLLIMKGVSPIGPTGVK